MKILDSLVTQAAGIAAIRRDIHAHPELCFEEQRTAEWLYTRIHATIAAMVAARSARGARVAVAGACNAAS